MESKWTQYAQGMITVEFDKDDVTKSESVNNRLLGYTRRFDPADFPANLRSLSLKHGSKFQNIEFILQSSQKQLSVTTFEVVDTNSADPMPTDCDTSDHIRFCHTSGIYSVAWSWISIRQC